MHTHHTPGPWAVDTTGYRTTGNGLCVMAGRECIAVAGESNPDQPQFANAKLIAAAPLLLEALKDAEQRMRSQLSLLKCDDEFIAHETAMARAAIAADTN